MWLVRRLIQLLQPFWQFPYNTSTLVRDALPEVIQRPGKKDIRILKYARVTRDTFEDVRRVSKDIWSGQRSLFLPELQPGEDGIVDVSFILHLGMVGPESQKDDFRFETLARRDGYEMPGDDGKLVDSPQLQSLGLPKVLTSSFDIDAAWQKVKAQFHVSVILTLLPASSWPASGSRRTLPRSSRTMRVFTFASSDCIRLWQSLF
jgi:hypothetical protein